MDALRTELVNLLSGGQAFEPFSTVVDSFKSEERGVVPNGAERSPWQIVEHMQFSLRDLLDFSKNENGGYKEKNWPEDYWPKHSEPKPGEWDHSVQAFQTGIAELKALLAESDRDLTEPFPWGSGQTLMHEVLLAAEHSAYHIGELIELQRWIRA
jgi:hypothetical protein